MKPLAVMGWLAVLAVTLLMGPGRAVGAARPDPAAAGASAVVSLLLDPGALTLPAGGPVPLAGIGESILAGVLADLGAVSIEKSFPRSEPGRAEGRDLNGLPVALVDLSGFHRLTFPSARAAAEAVVLLRAVEGVRHAEVLSTSGAPLQEPDDPYFDHWDGWLPDDAQWHLQNDGLGGEGICGEAAYGFDLGLRDLSYWLEAAGSADVTIGIVDVGIFDDCEGCPSLGPGCLSGHPDLRVINPSLADPSLYSRYPDIDFCGDHGTKMAGFAAALTDNGTGVAGVCPDCSLLDIAVPACPAGLCQESQGLEDCIDDGEPSCAFVSPNWHVWVQNAVSEPLPTTLAVLNCSFGLAEHASLERMAVLWNAYLQGTVTAAASGGTPDPYPDSMFPADAPFVVGVGGYNYRGQFWETETGCDFVPSSVPKSNAVGWRNITVCAPNSPPMVSTHPWIREDPHGDYYTFAGATSASAAAVSGGIGLIQAVAKETLGRYLDADDVSGVLEATALPFAEDPWDPETYEPLCSSCDPEWYGKGRADLAGAVAAAVSPERWDEMVLASADLLVTHVRDFQIPGDGRTWAELEAAAEPAFGIAGRAPRIGWVRKAGSNTYASYRQGMPDIDPGDRDALILQMAELGIHDAYMTRIDETGVARVTGYLYGHYDGDGALVFEGPNGVALTPAQDVEIRVVNYMTESVGADREGEPFPEGIRLKGPANPVAGPCRAEFSSPPAGRLRASVRDVSGREVRRLFDGRHPGGAGWIVWDGLAESGVPASSGVYWIAVAGGGASASAKVILVR